MGFTNGAAFLGNLQKDLDKRYREERTTANPPSWYKETKIDSETPEYLANRKKEFVIWTTTEGKAVEALTERLLEEPDSAERPLKFIFDMNGLLWGQIRAAKKYVASNRRLSPAQLAIVYRRIELWSIHEFCEQWEKVLPQPAIKALIFDSMQQRDEGKLKVVEGRLRPEAVAQADLYMKELLPPPPTLPRARTKARRDRARARGGGTKQKVAKPVPPIDHDRINARLDEAAEIFPPLHPPTDSEIDDEADPVICSLARKLRCFGFLISGSTEFDEAAVAVCQGYDGDDQRIETFAEPPDSIAVDSDGDARMEDVPGSPSPSPSTSPSSSSSATPDQSEPINIVVTLDCDMLYILSAIECRFVLQPYRQGGSTHWRLFDLLALSELPKALWPFDNTFATAFISVLVSDEKGGKVPGLGIVSACKDQKLVQLANHAEELVGIFARFRNDASAPPLFVTAFGKKCSSVQDLEDEFRGLFKADCELPFTLSDALDFTIGLRQSVPPSNPFQKQDVLKRLVVKHVEQQHSSAQDPPNSPPSHNHSVVPTFPASMPSSGIGSRIKPSTAKVSSHRSPSSPPEPNPRLASDTSQKLEEDRSINEEPDSSFPASGKSPLFPSSSSCITSQLDESSAATSSTSPSTQSIRPTRNPPPHGRRKCNLYGLREYEEGTCFSAAWRNERENQRQALKKDERYTKERQQKIADQLEFMRKDGNAPSEGSLDEDKILELRRERLQTEWTEKQKQVRDKQQQRRDEEKGEREDLREKDGKSKRKSGFKEGEIKGLGFKIEGYPLRCTGSKHLGKVFNHLRFRTRTDGERQFRESQAHRQSDTNAKRAATRAKNKQSKQAEEVPILVDPVGDGSPAGSSKEGGSSEPIKPAGEQDKAFRIPDSEKEEDWEELVDHFPHAAQIVFRALKVVGTDSMYKMAQYMAALSSIIITYEPGLLADITENTRTSVQLASTLSSVFVKMKLYDTPTEDETLASDGDIETFFNEYFNATRSTWSKASSRDRMKQVIIDYRCTRTELLLFTTAANSNSLVCFGMLLIAKELKVSKDDVPPAITYTPFYGLNASPLGTNAVVSARTWALLLSSRLSDTILSQPSSLVDVWANLPFTESFPPTSWFDDVQPPEGTTRTILSILARHYVDSTAVRSARSEQHKELHSFVRNQLRSVSAANSAEVIPVDTLQAQIVPLLRATMSEVLSDIALGEGEDEVDLESGLQLASRRIAESTVLMRQLIALGLDSAVDRIAEKGKRTQAARRTKAKGKGKEKDESDDDEEPLSESEDDDEDSTKFSLLTLGDLEDAAGEKKVSDDENEEDMKGTVRGGFRAVQLRTLGLQFAPAYGRYLYHCDPQGVWVDAKLLSWMSTDEGKNLLKICERRIDEVCRGIQSENENLSQRNLHREEEQGVEAEREQTRAERTASNYLNFSRGGKRDLKKEERAKSAENSTSPIRPDTSQMGDLHRPIFNPDGSNFENFRHRFESAKKKQNPAYRAKLMIHGIHNSPLIEIVDDESDSVYYQVRRSQAGFDLLKDACRIFDKAFTAPFKFGLIHSARMELIGELGPEFIRLLFNFDFKARLPYDRLYILEDHVQLFGIDIRQADSRGLAVAEKYDPPSKETYSQTFPRLMSTKRKTTSAYSTARWTRIGIISRPRTNAWTTFRTEKGKMREKQTREATKGKRRDDFETLTFGPMLVVNEEKKLVWGKEKEKEYRRRRQPPLGYSRTEILTQPRAGIAPNTNPSSKPARAVNAIAKALGRSPEKGVIRHHQTGKDPGETYIGYGTTVEQDSTKSKTQAVRNRTLVNKEKIFQSANMELLKETTTRKLTKMVNGESGRTVAATFDRPRASSAHTDQAQSSPEHHQNHILRSDASTINPALQSSLLGLRPPLIGNFAMHHRSNQTSWLDSQTSLALEVQIPRIYKEKSSDQGRAEEKSERAIEKEECCDAVEEVKLEPIPKEEPRSRRFALQQHGILIGDSKMTKTGRGTKVMQTVVNRPHARTDLRTFQGKVCEDHSSQLCPRPWCQRPLVYVARRGQTRSFNLRNLRCIKCKVIWHRDKVGSLNIVVLAASFHDFQVNLLEPRFSENLGHGPRLATKGPTEKLSIAVATFEKKHGRDITLSEYEGEIKRLSGASKAAVVEELEETRAKILEGEEAEDWEKQSSDDE